MLNNGWKLLNVGKVFSMGSVNMSYPLIQKTERVKTRKALIDLGYDRTSFTSNLGDGKYEEVWSNGINEIVIKWKAVSENIP